MVATEVDILHLRRAFRLAMNGRGLVEPNPMVGCVLVRNGQIIGEGWHTHFGGPHAEPTALANCRTRGNDPAGATAYVTLEPCCHLNKKTPPCAPRLIEAKVARVVAGCLDPNPAVNGQGFAMLRAAGIEVVGPLLEAEAKSLIEPFERGPIFTLKWAESADNKVAGPGGKRTQISGPESSLLVHQLRTRCDGILVGIGTVLKDDPLLMPRDVPVRRKPLRIVLDRNLRIPLESQLVRTAMQWPTLVVYDERSPSLVPVHCALETAGVQLLPMETDLNHPESDVFELADLLRNRFSLREVLVEAGPTLAASFLQFSDQKRSMSRADRIWLFRSPTRIDDDTAPIAPTVPQGYDQTGTIAVGRDQLTEYRKPIFLDSGKTWATPSPSADFLLAAESQRPATGSITGSEPIAP